MFIPLHDANALKHIRAQYVTITLIVANIAFFFLSIMGSQAEIQATVLGFGYIPAVAFDYAVLPPEYSVVPTPATYVTYAFLHGDIFHLGGNMLFLWVFGDNVEDALGHMRFLVFYLLCAVGGALVHVAVDPASQIPMIGASGAVSGVLGAYLMLHPRQRVWVLVLLRLPLPVPAWLALGGWFAFQLAGATVFADPEASIAYWAHVGGFVVGMVLVVPFRRRGLLLFGPPR